MTEQSSSTTQPINARFETEDDLVRSFVQFSVKTIPAAWRWIQEFDGGLGIADIVFAKQAGNSIRNREYLSRIPPRLAIFCSPCFSKRALNIEEFQLLLGSNHAQTIRTINQLKALQTIQQHKDKTLTIKSNKKPPYTEIISIEAKLSDWRRAHLQACRYTQYSHESWVLLDAARSRAAIANLDLFRRTGIGLATFSTAGQLYIHYKAEHREPTSEEKFWRAQALLARSTEIR
jgi:hypothetical protein